jgi:large subunit ribosomal protein L32
MASVAVPNVTKCPNCGEPKASHRVCMKCGHYKGKAVVEVPAEENE